MKERVIERFNALCASDGGLAQTRDAQNIGTYNEKRLHRFLKHSFGERDFEVEIGDYVADLVCESGIIEIQTGGFYPLVKKIEYFLRSTEYTVTVVHPLIANLTVVRMDKDTGEVIRKKTSPKHEAPIDMLCELYWLREFLGESRLKIIAPVISAEEYRFSERVRYRKKGAYDAELFPLEMLDILDVSTVPLVCSFLPGALFCGALP